VADTDGGLLILRESDPEIHRIYLPAVMRNY
jgi:hypothetical protein